MKHTLTLVFIFLLTPWLSAQRIVTAPGRYADLAYLPAREALYAVRPAGEGSDLCRIDPETGAVLSSYYLGNDPRRVVATSSGDYLYLAYGDQNVIQRYSLLTGEIDLTFSAGGEEAYDGPYYPEDLLPLRGSDDLLAVARRSYYSYPRAVGTVVFDGGRQLPVSDEDAGTSNVLAYTDLDRTLLGYNLETDYQLRTLEVSARGLTATAAYAGPVSGNPTLEYADGYLYTPAGEVIPVTDGVPGTLTAIPLDALEYYGGIAVEPDPATDRIYYLGNDTYNSRLTMAVYARTTYELLRTVTLDPYAPAYGSSGALELEQLGSEETFAYLTQDLTLGIVSLCAESPAPPPYEGPFVICYGGTLELTAPVGALPEGADVLWSDGQRGTTVSVTTEGEYSYRIVSPEGCPGTPSPFFYVYRSGYGEVAPYILDPVTNVLCTGGTVTLRAEHPYGLPVVWSTGDTTNELTVTEAGTYLAYGVEPEANCLTRPSDPFYVQPSAAVAPEAPVVDQGTRIDTCSVLPVDLTVAPDGLRYLWTFTAAFTEQADPYGNRVTVYPNYGPSDFSVQALDGVGCLSPRTTGNIRFRTPPEAPVIQYNEVTNTLASSRPGPLLWYYQDVLEGESAGRYYRPRRNGFYTARVKGERCLSDFSNLASVGGVTTGVADEEASRHILVYPNPAREVIYVNVTDQLRRELPRGTLTYGLYTAAGHLVRSGSLDPVQGSIAVGDLPAGTYLLTFESAGKAVLRKRVAVL